MISHATSLKNSGLVHRSINIAPPLDLRLKEEDVQFLQHQKVVKGFTKQKVTAESWRGHEVEDVIIDLLSGCLLSGDREIISESYKDPRKWQSSFSLGARLRGVSHHQGMCVVINGYIPPKSSSGYYHNLIEFCFKLFYLERIGEPISVLLHQSTPALFEEFFKMFTWENLQLKIMANRFVHVDKSVILPVPRFGRHAPLVPPSIFQDLDAKIQVNCKHIQVPKRIYIARVTRNAENQNQIEEVLRKHNFNKVFLEKLSLHDQVCLFRHASVVVGIHGAGLSNIVFSPHLTVIELANFACVPTFFFLSRQRGHKYYYLLNQNHDTSGLVDPDVDRNSFYKQKLQAPTYSPEELDSLLTEVLSGSGRN